MVRDTALLVAMIAVGAGWLVVHTALLIRTARAPGVSRVMRVLAWVPPVTLVVAWMAGVRGLVVVWVVHAAAYLALRSLA